MKIAIPLSSSERDTYFINQAYVKYLTLAGFTARLVTPHDDAIEVAKEIDGLLLPGGKDIDPLFYGYDNLSSRDADPEKDDFERRLMWAFANAGKRIFGICRGFQLIALEYLHRLSEEEHAVFQYYQDIGSHSQTGSLGLDRVVASHILYGYPNMLYGGAEDSTNSLLRVNSMHHQALIVGLSDKQLSEKPRVSKHMTVVAWTDRGLHLTKKEVGNVVEAFILRGWTAAPIMAVQWHPEELKDTALISNFFNGITVPDVKRLEKNKVIKVINKG